VLPLLTACGAIWQPQVRTELVQVPVTTYVPLPAALTAPLPAPVPPARNCRLADGTPAVCVNDALLSIAAWQEVLDRANEDRAAAAQLGLTPALLNPDTGMPAWR
jgi:hypothetical protein